MKNMYKRVQAIDTDTGEILGNILLKEGSEQLILKVVNEKQSDAIKKKNSNNSDIIEHIQRNEGTFVHLIYKYGFPLMDKLQARCEGSKANIHIIRFIQLATYSTFGGKLFDDNRNRIKKSSLSKIWQVENNRKSVNETYRLLIECGYIYETEEGYIMISEELIIKGAVEDFKRLKKEDTDLTYTRVFSKNVQDMYEGTESKCRKQLANLFKILPYINFKYNVFCENPTEVDSSKVIPLTWTDLARVCGYEEKKHINRFKKDLFKLKIYGYNVIGQFLTDSGYEILVNPKVYYAGDNIKDVEQLYSMFKMTLNTKAMG